ncbi:hypothetical protein [Staphylococcus haemolyticus]|uniref:hypothetical protein n=1 Tax=Staphylococcus haemolyticus TaxID=1283 RepID=UPI001304EADB|nr:hypothetical protein [Staphylococcus haemolyticus]
MSDEVVIHGVFKPHTELQISIDNSIQSVPLSDEEYKKQVKQYTFKKMRSE